MVLPLVVILLAAVLQAALVVRDELRVAHAARVAARAAVVEPDPVAARRAVEASGTELRGLVVRLEGGRASGEVVVAVVRAAPTPVPLVGRLLGGVRLEERMAAMVE